MTRAQQNSSQITKKPYDKLYNQEFYDNQVSGSYRSAKKYAAILWPLYKPTSVVDVGCGRGTWLKAFKDNGVETLVGFDGSWNSQENMVDEAIVFYDVELNKPFTNIANQRFDLAMSLEVAEHLEPSSAELFIENLTKLSDVVLFGAAFTKQGGTNHVNEQPHTYWADIFSRFDYTPFDLFRPIVWGDKDIEFCYQQNTFLYVRKSTQVFENLLSLGECPLENLYFLNCIHPLLYEFHADHSYKSLINQLVIKSLPSPLVPFARKLKHYLFG